MINDLVRNPAVVLQDVVVNGTRSIDELLNYRLSIGKQTQDRQLAIPMWPLSLPRRFGGAAGSIREHINIPGSRSGGHRGYQ